MPKFPVISSAHAAVILRIVIALIFLAHAIVRVSTPTIGQFAGFLENKGFPFALAIVWILTVYEIAAGLLLLAGVFTRWLALGFIIIVAAGIFIIHAANGWFVGEHGIGGMEYSVLLIAALIVVAAFDKEA